MNEIRAARAIEHIEGYAGNNDPSEAIIDFLVDLLHADVDLAACSKLAYTHYRDEVAERQWEQRYSMGPPQDEGDNP